MLNDCMKRASSAIIILLRSISQWSRKRIKANAYIYRLTDDAHWEYRLVKQSTVFSLDYSKEYKCWFVEEPRKRVHTATYTEISETKPPFACLLRRLSTLLRLGGKLYVGESTSDLGIISTQSGALELAHHSIRNPHACRLYASCGIFPLPSCARAWSIAVAGFSCKDLQHAHM